MHKLLEYCTAHKIREADAVARLSRAVKEIAEAWDMDNPDEAVAFLQDLDVQMDTAAEAERRSNPDFHYKSDDQRDFSEVDSLLKKGLMKPASELLMEKTALQKGKKGSKKGKCSEFRRKERERE